MIALVCGEKGSGKTKRLIQMANDDVKSCKGNVVFIDADKSQILDLKYDVRLMNAMDFNIDNIDKFHGFLCGTIGNNYDIEKIYIDGLYKIIKPEETSLEEFLEKIEALSNKHDINFIISVSRNASDIPKHIQKYISK